MRKNFIPFCCGLRPDQIEYLKTRSEKTGERDMNLFIRQALDVAIKKEKSKKREILDYTE